MKLTQKNFNRILNDNYSFENNPIISVAVSGGPDSMCLLFLLMQWCKKINGKLIVLIINHNLRKNSLVEVKSLGEYLKKNKINFQILSVKKNKIKKRNMSEARENRYKLLINFCKKNNILHLFVGHQKEDNIETFITRKISGSDFDGLQSIKLLTSINKTNIIRPLLFFSKKDIINYNLNKKIPFFQDPTNTNLYYTRPSIRKFLKETSRKNTNDIINDFNQILKYSKLYNVMISEILIYNLNNIDKNKITFKFENFIKIENLILEKITKKIYTFLLATDKILRSKKIQIFLSHINNQNFRSFNLGGMIIKKSNNLLVFSKNSN